MKKQISYGLPFAKLSRNVDRGWFMFFVTVLNHSFWVIGPAIGGIFGSLIKFNTEGLEFVMTALFVVIFIEQWMKEKKHYSALLGIEISNAGLIFFGGDNFIIPVMFAILAALTLVVLLHFWKKICLSQLQEALLYI
jgi:4-azaleucine resistance transporter AzlC